MNGRPPHRPAPIPRPRHHDCFRPTNTGTGRAPRGRRRFTSHGRFGGEGRVMPFMPFSILGVWLRGLLSIAIIAGGVALLRAWYVDSQTWRLVRVVDAAPARPAPEADREGNSDRAAAAVKVF